MRRAGEFFMYKKSGICIHIAGNVLTFYILSTFSFHIFHISAISVNFA